MWSLLTLHTNTHLGEELSLRGVLRWKREGAKHTARLVQVIWFSPTLAVTSLRKHSKVCRASRFSSGNNNTAALTACRRCSFGTSETDKGVSLVYSEHNVWGLYAVVQIYGAVLIQWYFGTKWLQIIQWNIHKNHGKPCLKTVFLMVYIYIYNLPLHYFTV